MLIKSSIDIVQDNIIKINIIGLYLIIFHIIEIIMKLINIFYVRTNIFPDF